MRNLNITMRKGQRARVKDTCLNVRPVIIKVINVIKFKGAWRNYLRLKEIKETHSPKKILHWNPLLKHTLAQLGTLVCRLDGNDILILSSLF